MKGGITQELHEVQDTMQNDSDESHFWDELVKDKLQPESAQNR